MEKGRKMEKFTIDNYIPDDLGLDEEIIISSKHTLFPIYYYVTTKRIFRENKLTHKILEEIEPRKVKDITITQSKIQSFKNRGTLYLEHSNFKKETPFMRKKFFCMKNVRSPQHVLIKLRRSFNI